MKIKSLQFKNNYLGWETIEIKIDYNLILLVGISGAGKSQILKSIYDLKMISKGTSINGFEWNIQFENNENTLCQWEGKYEVLENESLLYFSLNEVATKPIILYEKLDIDAKNIIERNSKQFIFLDKEMPKLSSNQSALYILKEENIIKKLIEELEHIVLHDFTTTRFESIVSEIPIKKLLEQYKTIEHIKNTNFDTKTKLFLIYKNQNHIFKTIKENFSTIFPQIQDIKIDTFKKSYNEKAQLFLWIKEKNIDRWIGEGSIASGMLRTLVHLTDVYVSKNGSIILIDEFENSLGINCMDILTENLIYENKNIQFIATSHHPYIINNIDFHYWKIVIRDKNKIKIIDASNYNLGKSKQSAFIQLTKILEQNEI